MPVLYENGKRRLTQSHVISRYLANKFGLVADNDWENARIDEVISIALTFSFVSAKIKIGRTTMFQNHPVQKKQLEAMLDGKIRLCYQRLTAILKEEEGDLILGSKLTHGGFWLANIVSIFDDPFSGDHSIMTAGTPDPQKSDIYVGLTSAEFPVLRKHLKAAESLPEIKEWIAKRHKTVF